MRLIITIWVLGMSLTSAAQLYSTRSGTLQLSGKKSGVAFTVRTNHLQVLVNYDKAEITMMLPLTTVAADNDSTVAMVKNLLVSDIHFTGKMNITQVQTNSHPKQKFLISGTLTVNSISRQFSFSAQLEHFPRGGISCNLSGKLEIDLTDFAIESRPGEQKVLLQFNQLILSRPGER